MQSSHNTMEHQASSSEMTSLMEKHTRKKSVMTKAQLTRKKKYWFFTIHDNLRQFHQTISAIVDAEAKFCQDIYLLEYVSFISPMYKTEYIRGLVQFTDDKFEEDVKDWWYHMIDDTINIDFEYSVGSEISHEISCIEKTSKLRASSFKYKYGKRRTGGYGLGLINHDTRLGKEIMYYMARGDDMVKIREYIGGSLQGIDFFDLKKYLNFHLEFNDFIAIKENRT